MREENLIAEMCAQLPKRSADVLLGIGDDTAILKPTQGPMLFCSDAMVENIHFKMAWSSAFDIGHKALATCLSDIVAMNGRPLYGVISLSLRPGLPEDFHRELYKGISALAAQHEVQIVGGDLTRSASEIFIDVSLIGESHFPTLRSGAKPGDLLLVSGPLGAAAAGLHCFQNSLSDFDVLKKSYLTPTPRFDLLPLLACDPSLVTAMMDLSDGLSTDLSRMAQASQVGFEVWAQKIPLHPDAIKLSQTYQIDLLDLALNGGEDYELLLTVNPQLWQKACEKQPRLLSSFTCIGHATGLITAVGEELGLVKKDGSKFLLTPRGWDPFS